MGIRLDWDVESDGGWQRVSEDPEAAADRKRRARRVRRTILACLLVVTLGSGAAILRLRHVDARLHASLEATIAAETLALRIGDREAFLAAQSEEKGWVDVQERTFDDYQALGARLEVSGEIVEMEIGARRAQVTLREWLDGQPTRVLWFYERTRSGWRHAPPPDDFWGDAVYENAPPACSLFYHEADREEIKALKEALVEWQAMAAPDGEWALPPARVRFTSDPQAITGWSGTAPWTLIIPSPLLGRIPEDGTANPDLRSALAEQIALFWAGELLPDTGGAEWAADWKRDELARLLWHTFDPSAPALRFLSWTAGTNPYRALVHFEQTNPEDYPDAWADFLTHMLRAESAVIARRGEGEARRLFRDPDRQRQANILNPPTLEMADPDTMAVTGIQQTGSLMWAEIQFVPAEYVGGPEGFTVTYEPFRAVDGQIWHTWPLGEDWGEVHEERGEHVILRYYTLDAPFMGGLLDYLEVAFMDYVTELGLSVEQPTVLVSVSPFVDWLLFSPDELPPRLICFSLRSPYIATRPSTETAAEHLRLVALFKLRDRMKAYHTKEAVPWHFPG